MQKSEHINELASAFSKAQGEFKGVKPDAENPFFKSHFATLEAIQTTTYPILSKFGLCVSQPTDERPDGTYIETVLMHASGQWISGNFKVIMSKLDPQAKGSAVSYAKRQALKSLLGISDKTDDDDAEKAVDRGREIFDKAPEKITRDPKDAWEREKVKSIQTCMNVEKALREGTKYLPWEKKVYDYGVNNKLWNPESRNV